MNLKELSLFFVILFFIQFSTIAFAADVEIIPPEWYTTDVQWFFETALGFPDEWMTIHGFIWKFIVPFVGVWAIILGFLRAIRIFQDQPRLEMVISFVASFMTIPSGLLRGFVFWMFALMGGWSTFLFFGLFFFGTLLYALATGRSWWGFGWGESGGFERSSKQIERNLRQLYEKRSRLEREIIERSAKGETTNIADLEKKMDKIDARIEALKALRTRSARRA